MHELSMIESILELALTKAHEAEATQIREIKLAVGDLSGVVPEALAFAFEACRSGTLASQATLTIERLPAICHCETCTRDFSPSDWIYECPNCGTLSQTLKQGRELQLTSLEVV